MMLGAVQGLDVYSPISQGVLKHAGFRLIRSDKSLGTRPQRLRSGNETN